MSTNVLPRSTLYGEVHGLNMNAKLYREFTLSRFTGCVSPAGISNNIVGEFCECLTFANAMSALRHSVLHVVSPSSEKQVVGADARTVVAFVKHALIVCYRAVGQYPRDAVRESRSALKVAVPVSLTLLGASPLPARIRLADAAPKSIIEGSRIVAHVGLLGANCHAGGCLRIASALSIYPSHYIA